MVFLFNPTLWVGLLTLIVLEIVLSIDNLIFIAILAGKLQPKKRIKARCIGLFLSLTIRLIVLTVISWITTLTSPIISNKYFNLSGHDLILLFGGLFLLCKTTIELYEKLKQFTKKNYQNNTCYSDFWIIVIQISIIDIVFSFDSVITAIGIVNELFIMVAAVIISNILMLISSEILTKIINSYKTITILCLIFLLMVGINLIIESFGIYIPHIYMLQQDLSLCIKIVNKI